MPFLTAGCSGGSGAKDPSLPIPPVVRDSAGVTIVENAEPQWAPGSEWRVGRVVTSIGEVQGDPAHELYRVSDATRLSDGTVVVGNSSSGEIRFFDQDGVFRRQVGSERHGATFQFSPLGSAYGFTHPWLKEALALDSGGPAGDAAFLRLMEMGFETSVACGEQGGVGFRAVIEKGEAFLRERSGSPMEAEVHFLLAEAYSDIVGLANGLAYQESEDTLYVAEAPHARERAIQEYRAAFSLAGASARAADSWENAWRLMAGLTPPRTFFYCVYD